MRDFFRPGLVPPTLRTAASLLVVTALTARAQQHSHARADTIGSVHFATSCRPVAASPFNRSVALLHSFEFGGAIRGFQDVLAADSSCAMAYWGIALARWTNPMAAGLRAPALLQQGRDAAQHAAALGGGASEREREYIAAVGRLYDDFEHVAQNTRVAAYERAMADVARRQPADTEAKIFHAIALVASAPPSDKSYAKQLAAGAVLESLWVRQPNHPGLAHYIIHAYDVPALAPRAAAAAARYATIAPSAAHALHMPSHTFTRRGQWDESIATNARSIDAALRDAGSGEALHAADYTVYALLQEARDDEALAFVDRLPALAASFDPRAITGAAPPAAGVFAIAAIPARYALERNDWERAVSLRVPPESQLFPWTAAMIHFAHALGAAHRGDPSRAQPPIDSLGAIEARLRSSGEGYWAEQVAIQRLGANAWAEFAAHHADSALALMRAAAQREDATEKNAVTPGPLMPAREQLGDMLLELGRGKEALAEYEATLVKEPNRFRSVYGAMRAARAANDRVSWLQYQNALLALCAKGDRPGRPELRSIR